MCDSQSNNKFDISSEHKQQSHYDHARKIIESWPEWKKNIRCMPNSINGNQSDKSPDKK